MARIWRLQSLRSRVFIWPHVECSDEKKRLAAGKKVAKRYAKGRALPFISGAK